MSELSVLWISNSYLFPKMYNIDHTHDYFHFTYTYAGTFLSHRKDLIKIPGISCIPPGVINSGGYSVVDTRSINVMFLVEDKKLYKEICNFSFQDVPEDSNCSDLLLDIVEQVKTSSPSPEFVNSAFSYYLQLLMLKNSHLKIRSTDLAEQCNDYIEAHYMENVELSDIAEHIHRSRTYTSTLYNDTFGESLIDHLNFVRVKHACNLIAYSNFSHEEIFVKCGFSNYRNFSRVFKKYVGVSPGRYITSHRINDLKYDGETEDLKKLSYNEESFTYIVNAQKRITWKSPYEYLHQSPEKPEV